MHGRHEGKGTILYDGCDQCEHMSGRPWMFDKPSLQGIAALAKQLKDEVPSIRGQVSHAEFKAVEVLREHARYVFASGITEEVAR